MIICSNHTSPILNMRDHEKTKTTPLSTVAPFHLLQGATGLGRSQLASALPPEVGLAIFRITPFSPTKILFCFSNCRLTRIFGKVKSNIFLVSLLLLFLFGQQTSWLLPCCCLKMVPCQVLKLHVPSNTPRANFTHFAVFTRSVLVEQQL